ncbi:MAG: 30S ribosomal protein S1 [Gammaproteobacteria bacterium]|nr:30S ribosomal protein S1 [Gammaproteobacteria bacterium]
MKESFAQLFEESLKKIEMEPGTIVKGLVLKVANGFVLIDAGLKSEAVIPAEQFRDEKGEITVKAGDIVEVALDTVEDSNGETRLSREKAKRAEVWRKLEAAHEANAVIIGVITGKVKGGFTVELDGVRAFLPGSLVDVRPLRDTSALENKPLEFKLIKIDAKRNNVVVSRRAVIELEGSAERDAVLENLTEGQEIKGIVKNLTDYGAFIDLGGVDGLLHITDMSWKRIKHPNEMIAVGDEIKVKVLKFERERGRVSLGLKQLGEDPWVNLVGKFPEGKKVHGRVTNIADYGCFVELEDGVEGLVHVSEMDWTNKNISPSKVVQLGQEVDVIVLDIDPERRRISLGLKQCVDNPWAKFAQTHQKGDKVSGTIKSITDFGVFIGLDGGIDGLIHLSDLSWNQTGEEAVRNFKKGDSITAIVLGVDTERERISLGVKQMEHDPFSHFSQNYEKGASVKGTITEVDERGATVDLGDGLQGYIRASEISRDRIEDARQHLKSGEAIEATYIGIDRKNQMVNLSIKALEDHEHKQAAQTYMNSDEKTGNTTLGDLLKEKLNKQ